MRPSEESIVSPGWDSRNLDDRQLVVIAWHYRLSSFGHLKGFTYPQCSNAASKTTQIIPKNDFPESTIWASSTASIVGTIWENLTGLGLTWLSTKQCCHQPASIRSKKNSILPCGWLFWMAWGSIIHFPPLSTTIYRTWRLQCSN